MLDWSKASHYSFLEDFELLRETCQDIHAKLWAEPVVQATMKQWQCILCAKEIYNCNIEIHCLYTHVLDESTDLKKITCKLHEQGHLITGVVNDYAVHCLCTNMHLLVCILWINNLQDYDGSMTPGIQVGHLTSSNMELADTVEESQSLDQDEDEEYDIGEDDKMWKEYGGLIDFVSDIPLHNQ